MGNKRVKTYIAFLLLCALVTQNSYSSIAEIGNVKSVYASEVDENGTVKEEIVSDDTVIPSEDVSTPGDETQTPSENTSTPSENVSTPSENTSTPSENAGTPSENAGTPSENTGTPSENAGTPSENTITPSMDKVVEGELEIIDGMIVGKGYDTITISVNSLKLGEKKFYNLFIDTKAAGITANEKTIVGNKLGKYNNSVESVVIKGLNSESFKIYAKGITTDVSASFDVTSIEAGTVNMTVMSDAEAVRRVYEYHDKDVKVTATLAEASAIPDDAELNVTAIKEGKEYDNYVKMIEEKSKEDPSLLLSNYLLYDISFILDGQEIEPEQGSVTVTMDFLKKQLKEANSTSVNEVVVLHVNDKNECEVLEDSEADTTKNVVNQVEFATDSFSAFIIAVNGELSKDVFDSNNYNLHYILNHFNLFISGDVKTNHTVGEVAVGGKGTFLNGIGNDIYHHTVPSYIKGIFEPNDGNAITTEKDNFIFYLGRDNKGKTINSSKILDIRITDDYIDFTAATAKIQKEMEYLSKNLFKELNLEDGKYQIKEGTNYKFNINNNSLNFDMSTAKPGTDTFILDDSKDTISFNCITIENKNESASGISVVYLFPYATKIVIPSSATPFYGHIVAPNAEIEMQSGNYNGCIIGTKLTGEAEGHMLPYNGKILKTTEAKLNAYKKVDGKEPKENQVFQFKLYEKIDSVWGNEPIQTVSNKFENVNFDCINYSEAQQGEHLYKIVESYDASLGYKENKTVYYAKVDAQSSSVHYYSDENCKSKNEILNEKNVIFDNIPGGILKVHKSGGYSGKYYYFTICDKKGIPVKDSNGNKCWSISGNGGVVTVSGLSIGTYTINEVNKDGTSLGSDFPYIVSYSEKNDEVKINFAKTKEFYITNTPKPDTFLTLYKYDKTNGGLLDGAIFKLEYEVCTGSHYKPSYQWKPLYENMEAKDGILKIPTLEFDAKYRIVETNPPEGYKELGTIIEFNYKQGEYRYYNGWYNGWYYNGWYYNYNVFSDEIYDKSYVSFTQSDQQCDCDFRTSGILKVYNDKIFGSIKLTKKDESGTPLPGAQFELYKKDSNDKGVLYETANANEGTVEYGSKVINKNSTYQVDDDGRLKISKLPIGKYYFKEVVSPYGYVLPTKNAAEFEISGNNKNNDFSYEVINEPMLGSFKITKVDESKKPLPGAKFELVDPNHTEQRIPVKGEDGSYQYDPKGNVVLLQTDNNSSLEVFGLPFGMYQLKEVTAPEGYSIRKAVSTNIVINSSETVSHNIINSKKTANVEFYKADEESKETISGATFKLYKVVGNKDDDKNNENDDDVKDTIVSDKDGKVYKQNLEVGDYYFKEVTAPLGYQLDNTKTEFTISKDDDGKTIQLGDADHKIYNKRAKGRVVIEKTDSSGILIDGATFELYFNKSKNSFKDNITTVSGSVIIDELPWGDYYLVETKAPTGKVISTQQYPFTISANHLEDSTYTGAKAIKNESIKGSVKLIKSDSVTNEPMSGVEFELFKLNDDQTKESKILNKTADGKFITQNGILQVDDLEYGNYYFVEQQVVGYKANTKPYNFTIEKPTKVEIKIIKVKNNPILGKVTISKNDSKGKSLAGAKFTLYSTENTNGKETIEYENKIYYKVKTSTTKEDGLVTFKGLKWGDYAIKETKAPKGYMLNKEIQYFTVNAEEQTFEYSYTDYELTGSIILKKVDATKSKKTLSGANFQLYKDGAPYVKDQILTTDENGSISVDNLPWGTYKFVEKKAPDGYILNEEQNFTEEITIGRENVSRTLTYKVSNQPTQIYFSKQSVNGNSEIKGAVLAVSDISGNVIESWKSKNKPHLIKAKLSTDKTYVMSEIKAPNGYAYSEPVNFEVLKDGTVKILNTLNDLNDSDPYTVVMKDKPFELKIRKTDSSGNVLAGAKFILRDSQNKKVDKWTSESGEKEFHMVKASKLSANETYQLSENIAPEGYQIAKQITITISSNGTITSTTEGAISGNTITMKDEPISGNVTFKKVDETDSKPLESVSFNLYRVIDSNGKFIKKYQTNEKGIISVNGLLYGDYYFEEITPEGYQDNTEKIAFKISEQGTTVKLDNVINKRKLGSVTLKKIEGISGNVLQGADFQLYKDREPYDKVGIMTTDKNGSISVNDLPWGTYYFVETKAPDGYILDSKPTEDIIISSNTVSGTLPFKTVSNQPTQIYFSKKSLKNELEVAGAVLEIREKDNKDAIPIRWKSTNEPRLITAKLNPKTTYMMSEIKAPNGYSYANPIEFTVSDNGLVNGEMDTVIMWDDPFELKVRKTGLSGNGLAGADFALKHLKSDVSEEKIIERWTSSGNEAYHVVDATLLDAGETYELIEEKAPEGYQTAEKITISISRNGTITTTPKDALIDGIVMVRDEVISGNVILKKIDATDKKPLKSVSFNLYRGIAPGGTLIKQYETDENGIISEKGLLYGNYYFKEITPQGYQEYTGDLSFKISEHDKTIELNNVMNVRKLGSVTLTKIDGVSKNGVFQTLSGAEFKLYSKEPQSAPQSMLSFFLKNVYYEYQNNGDTVYTTGDDGKITVSGLPWGSYYFVETKAPKGYVTPTDTTYPFIIDGTKEKQLTIDLGEIKNYKEETKVPEKKKKKSSSEERTVTTTSTGNSVTGVLGISAAPVSGVLGARMSPLTGDNLNAFFWLILLSLSGGTFGTVVFVTKRKKRKVE